MRTASQLCNSGGRLWLFIGLFALLYRLLVLIPFSSTPYFLPTGEDMKFYHDWALRVMDGRGTDGGAFYGLPGYPYLLAALYTVFGIGSWSVAIFQCVLDSLTAVVIGRLAFECFGNLPPSTRLAGSGLAALGWITFLPAQTYSVILMPTSIVVAAFWGTVWWVVSRGGRATWKTWSAIGLCIGVVSMAVATILMLLPLLAVAVGVRSRQEGTLRRKMIAGPRIAA
jgi:4-amino-4-deoxy-L-arabinose transferase-like glycosyltransferase